MPQNNYIGVNGLVTQSLEEIRADLITKFQQIYGTDINLEQNSPDGQWLNILAQEKKDILDLFTQYYNNLDVDRVVGIPQQILYKLNGLTINAYTYSYVYVDVTTTQALNLNGISIDEENNADATGYTVSDSNGNRWILTTGTSDNTVSLTAGVNQNLRFRAADLGSVTALPNTITIMETIIAGVTGVNNPANNHITGATGESDAEFRIRRNRSVTVASQGFADSIEAQLLNTENVTQAKVYQNRTDETDDNGIPPHAVWVICEGGADEDVARVIYNNVPPGITMHGAKSVQITRANGLIDTVEYDIGAPEDLHVEMYIKQLGTVIDESYVKQELSKLTWNIGESAEAANISTDVKDIIGETGTPYDVGVSLTGTAGSYSEIVTPAALNGYFTLSTDNITIHTVV